jgi:hypothetical protein
MRRFRPGTPLTPRGAAYTLFSLCHGGLGRRKYRVGPPFETVS